SASMLVGPFLAKEKNAVFLKKWTQELQHTQNIYEQISRAASTEQNKQKLKELADRIELLKEVIDHG
ncbi:tRNA (adenine(22)-N(1))-methyltransferase TrmK, partial [Bacillus spizizenii]|nr:tRNA (adenine(22)-N(1))-methyltransferase TrmK [Bacillus spizizenii]